MRRSSVPRSTFSVRLVREDDLRGVLRLYNAFNRESLHLSQFRKLMAQTTGSDFIFVARGDRTVVGYLIVKIDVSIEAAGTRAEVTDLYVSPKWRRRGLGTQLLKEAMAFATSKKAKYVFLFTSPRNRVARELYRALGLKNRSSKTIVYVKDLVRGATASHGP